MDMTRWPWAVVLATLLAGPGEEKVLGDLVIFKDGFVVRGRVKEPRKLEIDGGVPIVIPSGFMYVDDGARRVIFVPASSQLIDAVKQDPSLDKDLVKILRPPSRIQIKRMPSWWQVDSMGSFDDAWIRPVTLKTKSGGTIDFKQRIVALTPKYLQIQSQIYQWDPCYLTSELAPELARQLLFQHFQGQKNLTEPQKRLEIFRFLFQAGWLDHAGKELVALERDHPEVALSLEPEKQNLKTVRANLVVEDVERLHKVGQHQAAYERLSQFLKNDLAKLAKNKALAQDYLTKYETAQKKMEDAGVLLNSLLKQLESDPEEVFTRAKTEITRQLNFDTIARLENFLTYAQQHDRQIKSGKSPTQTADEILALALTGWMHGNPGADTDGKMAQAQWTARQLLLTLQKSDNPPAAQAALIGYCEKTKITADVLAQIIRTLPPADPPKKQEGRIFKVEIAAPDSPGGEYWVQLPPEYHANRQYPVLLTLHAGDETPLDSLKRWAALAADQGYILVAPAWRTGRGTAYQYSAAEHHLVLDCIRDLRRRFQVDSDRVFLYGRRQGGVMAYDVGLSHPDQFAGVLPQNASPKFFPLRYWSNAQYVNVYVVEGDGNGNNPRENREIFQHWIRWHYPAMYVEYKGRGAEWFAGELPIMFDWMSRKKRSHPLRELGRLNSAKTYDSESFKTHRTCDNRFYWLSTEPKSILPHCLNSARNWDNRTQPAFMLGQIRTGNQVNLKFVDPKKDGVADNVRIWNQINVTTSGLKQLTIWLGPNMIDFTKPTAVIHNGQRVGGARKIQPSLTTLLDDFYYTGDRQRVFFAKIDINL